MLLDCPLQSQVPCASILASSGAVLSPSGLQEPSLDSASSLRVARLFSLQFTLHSSARSNGLKPKPIMSLQVPDLICYYKHHACLCTCHYSNLLAFLVALHLQSSFLGSWLTICPSPPQPQASRCLGQKLYFPSVCSWHGPALST